MHETAAEVAAMQRLLDASYEQAGPHVHATIEPKRRLDAMAMLERLEGMRYFIVATVSADGRPFTGPVDSFWIHGRLWFSSSPESVKVRHLRARPACSATYVDGLHALVIAHGEVTFIDPRSVPDVIAILRKEYPGFEQWAPAEYCVLTPTKLFAATFE
jgi:hypothetical protein